MIDDEAIHTLGMISQFLLMALGIVYLVQNISYTAALITGGTLLSFLLWSIYIDLTDEGDGVG